jgi:uncharacterized membrane protein YhaH (DUF805 family)
MQVIINLFSFSGRISREEYYKRLKHYLKILAVYAIISFSLLKNKELRFVLENAWSLFSTVFFMSLHVRRFHDIGKSGLLIYIATSFSVGYFILKKINPEFASAVVPGVGIIAGFVGVYIAYNCFFKAGDQVSNLYGEPVNLNSNTIENLKETKRSGARVIFLNALFVSIFSCLAATALLLFAIPGNDPNGDFGKLVVKVYAACIFGPFLLASIIYFWFKKHLDKEMENVQPLAANSQLVSNQEIKV